MQCYQCKCGRLQSWGSMGPSRCSRCFKCGSDLAISPDSHGEPQPHEWYEEMVETDAGEQPLTRCRFCHQTRRDILTDERVESHPKLGLDFGNVIKAQGEAGPMDGFTTAMATLKETFGSEVYVISRVDDDSGEQKVLDFLREHNFLGDAGIPSNHVYFCRERKDKADIAAKLELTHFVDDRTEVLAPMGSVKYRYAMNPEDQQRRLFPPTGMVVVYSWWDAVKAIVDN